jgi:hypothetical protein
MFAGICCAAIDAALSAFALALRASACATVSMLTGTRNGGVSGESAKTVHQC